MIPKIYTRFLETPVKLCDFLPFLIFIGFPSL